MKLIYEQPMMNLIPLSNEDVITTSGEGIMEAVDLGEVSKTFNWQDLT